MNNLMMSEAEVLKFLGAKDFRNVNKKQVIKMVSNLHKMNPIVAIKCIEQFPNFAATARVMVHDLSNTCKEAIDKGGDETAIILTSYLNTIEKLTDMLTDPNMSVEEKDVISKTIVYIGQQIAEHKQLATKERIDLIKIASAAAMGFAGLLGAAIGIGFKVSGKKPNQSEYLEDRDDD